MRRAPLRSLAVVVAATALAGCSVELEGAACRVAGSTADCPTGQRCGTDLTCSVRAAGCTPCEAGALDCRAGQKDVMECSAAGDPACGTWKPAVTCEAGLQACQRPPAGEPACVCASWTVIPGGSAAACTRPSIALAIEEAVKFPSPLVFLGGAAPATYGNELDDQAPIVIPAGVTLIGDGAATAAATNRIIAVQGPGPEGLRVHGGAVVRGVAVRRADAGGPTIGVALMGGAAASGNTLEAVRIDAGGAGGFATGLRVAGANAVAVGDVLVQGATVAGLEVNRLAAADVVLVDRSVFDQNQVGVSLLRGDLTLSGSVVKRSGGEGVSSATGASGLTSLAVLDGVVSWNGTAGMVLSGNDKVVVQWTRVCSNVGSDRGPTGQKRRVGGIFAQGNPPASLVFSGNWVHDNGGDQVYVINSTGSWDLSGGADCAVSNRNVFANYTAPGVGVAADSASVNALFNYWGNAFPVLNTDYTGTGPVDVGTQAGASNYCAHTPIADLTCPSP